MRASDLIGKVVEYPGGKRLGVVTDIRCVQSGPLRGVMQAPTIQGLLVSPRRVGSLLGYDRRRQQGPWLLRIIVSRLHRGAVIVAWESVAEYDDAITLHADWPNRADVLPR